MSKVHYFKGALAGGALAALGGFLAPAALAAPVPGQGAALAATLEAVTRGNSGNHGNQVDHAGSRHDGSLCVTAPFGKGQLTLQSCDGRAAQDVVRHGDYYVFEGDRGYVMDDRGWSTTPGTAVIAYPQNGGRNQHWSAPTTWR